LEDHRDAGTAHLGGVFPVRGYDFTAAEKYPASDDARRAREKPERRESRQALPASALTHQADAGARLHAQVYGANHVTVTDGDAQAVNV
jgi:hypothetical protein